MSRLTIISRKTLCLIACCIIFQSPVYAQVSLDESIDCTNVKIDYSNDPTLTREERIHHMNKALYKSLSQFELCQSELEKSAAAAGGAGSGGNNGDNGRNDANGSSGESGKSDSSSSSKGDTGESAQESVASSTMSGTEPPNINSGMENDEVSDSVNSTSNQTNNADTSNGTRNLATGGQRPADIPPSDNDNALAAQIRYAAEKETDPVKKAQLWNEYRKYKGLPLKQ